MLSPVLFARLGRAVWTIALCTLLAAPFAYGQSTSTFNGRILDQGDLVLPGVTVTATPDRHGADAQCHDG